MSLILEMPSRDFVICSDSGAAIGSGAGDRTFTKGEAETYLAWLRSIGAAAPSDRVRPESELISIRNRRARE